MATKQQRQGSPKGLSRWLYRAPIPLYRARLGFLLGRRLVMIEHVGRRSGKVRRAVLEAVAASDEAIYLAAAWGEKAQWLRNIRSNPKVTVHWGSRVFPTVASEVSAERARAVLGGYAAEHPKALHALAGFMLEDPSDDLGEIVDRMAADIPIVELPRT